LLSPLTIYQRETASTLGLPEEKSAHNALSNKYTLVVNMEIQQIKKGIEKKYFRGSFTGSEIVR